MKRLKPSKDNIIQMAKRLEWGDTFYKIDEGSIADALIEARYHLEFGCSKEELAEKRAKKAVKVLDKILY